MEPNSKVFKDQEFDLADLSLQKFCPELKNIKLEDTQYLSIFDLLEFQNEHFLNFDLTQKFSQPYV
jgi:hypothetical protein